MLFPQGVAVDSVILTGCTVLVGSNPLIVPADQVVLVVRVVAADRQVIPFTLHIPTTGRHHVGTPHR